MIRLKVPADEASSLLCGIPNKRAQGAIEARWRIMPNGDPDPHSICWLYCWAKTGMGSQRAAREAQRVFDAIFDRSFDWVAARVDHEWAREARYTSRDITSELEAMLRR